MLAELIRIFHIIIIVFVLIGPFLNKSSLLLLHFMLSLSLLLHWYHNNNTCFLTTLEGQIRGINYENGFIHQFVGPMYEIKNESHEFYIIVIILMIMSFYKLYKKYHEHNGDLIKLLHD